MPTDFFLAKILLIFFISPIGNNGILLPRLVTLSVYKRNILSLRKPLFNFINGYVGDVCNDLIKISIGIYCEFIG